MADKKKTVLDDSKMPLIPMIEKLPLKEPKGKKKEQKPKKSGK